MADGSEADAERRRAMSPVLGLDEFRPVSSSVTVEFGVRSHTGRGRSVNEDHYLIVRLARSQDVIATIYTLLGVSPEQEFADRFDRPLKILNGVGRFIHELV